MTDIGFLMVDKSPALQLYLTVLLSAQAMSANAEMTLLEQDRFRAKGSIDAAFGYYHSDNTNFGLGRVDAFNGDNTGDAQWGEGYVRPALSFDYSTENLGNLYAGISTVGAFTVGDGDAGGYTRATQDLSLELLYVGWKSSKLYVDSLGENALSVSYGRQNFRIGDGLLICDGNFDMQDKGAYWLAPRTAFARAGLVQLDTENYHSDLFYLKSDYTWENSALVGFNIERKQLLSGRIGATYIRILDSTFGAFRLVRDSMNVYSASFSDISPPGFDNLDFAGNYIYEHGEGYQGKKNAFGWYLEGKYRLADTPWQPTLNYRYVHFSGDNDPLDHQSTTFDPLFYGYSGWGTWYQGEIVGTYLLFNSNRKTHMFQLSASPTDKLTLGGIYYHFDLDANNYWGTSVTSKNFADEVDFYADLILTEQVSISAAYALAVPGKGGVQAFGDNKATHMLEAMLYVKF